MGAGDNTTLPERLDPRVTTVAAALAFALARLTGDDPGLFRRIADGQAALGELAVALEAAEAERDATRREKWSERGVMLDLQARVEAVERERDDPFRYVPKSQFDRCVDEWIALRTDEQKARRAAEARVVALEEALRQAQDELDYALSEFRIRDFMDAEEAVKKAFGILASQFVNKNDPAVLASSVKQGQEGLGGQRSALSRAQEGQP